MLRDIWGTVFAYEEVLYIELGSGHTRRSISRRGEIEAIKAIVKRPAATEGFQRMQNAGLFDKTFEAVVLRDPGLFSCRSGCRKLQTSTKEWRSCTFIRPC